MASDQKKRKLLPTGGGAWSGLQPTVPEIVPPPKEYPPPQPVTGTFPMGGGAWSGQQVTSTSQVPELSMPSAEELAMLPPEIAQRFVKWATEVEPLPLFQNKHEREKNQWRQAFLAEEIAPLIDKEKYSEEQMAVIKKYAQPNFFEAFGRHLAYSLWPFMREAPRMKPEQPLGAGAGHMLGMLPGFMLGGAGAAKAVPGVGALARGARGAMTFMAPTVSQVAAGRAEPSELVGEAIFGGLGWGPAKPLVGALSSGVGAAALHATMHPDQGNPWVTGLLTAATVGVLRKFEGVLHNRAHKKQINAADELAIELAGYKYEEPVHIGIRKIDAPTSMQAEVAAREAEAVRGMLRRVDLDIQDLGPKLQRAGQEDLFRQMNTVAADVRAASKVSEVETINALSKYEAFMFDAEKAVGTLPAEYWTGGDSALRLSDEGLAMLEKDVLGPRSNPVIKALRDRPIPVDSVKFQRLQEAGNEAVLYEYIAKQAVGAEGGGKPLSEKALKEFGYTRRNLSDFIESIHKRGILADKPEVIRPLEDMETIRGYPEVMNEKVRRTIYAKREEIANLRVSDAKKQELTSDLDVEAAKIDRAERGQPYTDADVGTYDRELATSYDPETGAKTLEGLAIRNIDDIGAVYRPSTEQWGNPMFVAEQMQAKGIYGTWNSKSGKVSWKDPATKKLVTIKAPELEGFPSAGDTTELGHIVITTKGDKGFNIVEQNGEYFAWNKSGAVKKGHQKPLTLSQVQDILYTHGGFQLERIHPDGGLQVTKIASGVRSTVKEYQLRKMAAKVALTDNLSPETRELLDASSFSARGIHLPPTDGPPGMVPTPLRHITPRKPLFGMYQEALGVPIQDVWASMEQLGLRRTREWGRSLGPRMRNLTRDLDHTNDKAIWEYITRPLGQRAKFAKEMSMTRGDVNLAKESESILREVFGDNYEPIMREWIPEYKAFLEGTPTASIEKKIQILNELRKQKAPHRAATAKKYGLTEEASLDEVAEAILNTELGGRVGRGPKPRVDAENVPEELKVWIEHGLVPETTRFYDFINNSFATKMRMHLSPYYEQMNEIKDLVRGANLTPGTRNKVIKDISTYQHQIMASVSSDKKVASDLFQVLNKQLGLKLEGDIGSWFTGHFLLLGYTGSMPLRLGLVLRNMTQTFTTTFLYAGADNYQRGFRRAFTPKGRALTRELGLNEMTAVPLEQYLAKGVVRKGYELGMKGYKWVDSWVNRHISANIGYSAIQKHAPRFINGKISLQEFKVETGMIFLDKATQKSILSELARETRIVAGKPVPIFKAERIERASKKMALNLAEDTQWIYRTGNAARAFTTKIGRFFGQYGVWPTNFARFWLRGVRTGNLKATESFLLRWAAVNGVLDQGGRHILGVDFRPWLLYGPFSYRGGPGAQLVKNVMDLESVGIRKDLAKKDLIRQGRSMIPFSMAIRDLVDFTNEEELSDALRELTGFRKWPHERR